MLGRILGFWKGNLRKIGVLVKKNWKNNVFFFGKILEKSIFLEIEILGFRVKDLKNEKSVGFRI